MTPETANPLVDFIINPEFIGSLVAAAIGILGLLFALRSEGHRLRAQLQHDERRREDDLRREENAVLEWYYSRSLQLRSALFLEARLISEFAEAITPEDREDTSEAFLRFALESARYQDFVASSFARRPSLLPETMVDEFSRIEKGEMRGRILNTELLLQSTFAEASQQNYKLQKFIELKLEGIDRIGDVVQTIDLMIQSRSYVISRLLEEAHALIRANPWNNEYIENWQSDMERSVFLRLKELSDMVEIPERCKTDEEK